MIMHGGGTRPIVADEDKVYCVNCKYYVKEVGAKPFQNITDGCAYILKKIFKHSYNHKTLAKIIFPIPTEDNEYNNCGYYKTKWWKCRLWWRWWLKT